MADERDELERRNMLAMDRLLAGMSVEQREADERMPTTEEFEALTILPSDGEG